MLSTNANFDAKHNLDYKTPMYLIHFDGESTDYVNYTPGSPDNTCKDHLVSISGLQSKVAPEEGRASIGGIKATILDYDDEITALLATDTYYFHRKKTTIKAGYLGLDESDMLTIFTGWVTGLQMGPDLVTWEFDITDPQKWMQRKIFRDSEDVPVTIQGNPINIILWILTSTGAGTNGDYDVYAAANGLGIDDDFVNITALEALRDSWFPGPSWRFEMVIDERIKAKDFLEREFYKVLNLYPVIDGQGRFSLKRFRPPLAALDGVQTFDNDNIIDLPKYDMNLDATINELEFHYDYDTDDDEYDTQDFYTDTTSVNNRGPGKKALVIKSKGITTANGGVDISEKRQRTVFGRFATPPPKITCQTFFSRWLSEAGDIVPLTHALLPDVEAGTRGITSKRMEIISRAIDWKNGKANFEFLATGFDQEQYCVISPSMTVTSGASATEFDVSSADAAKFEEGWEIEVRDDKGRLKASNLTITDITGTTITCDSIGSTPAAGWIVNFTNYDGAITAQQLYWYLSDGSDKLGTDNDDAHYLVA